MPAWARSLLPAALLLLLQVVVWPISFGTLVSGLILGALGALVALGMALIWRANHVVNFAQGEMGALPATFVLVMMEAWKLPYLAGLGIGLASAIVLGGVIDLFIIRRFAKAPRLILTVVTLGISQILAFCTILLPRAWGEVAAIRTYAPPIDLSFQIGEVIFDANDVIGASVAVALGIALVWFLRATDTGIAIRAAAEGADRANMLGIPVARLGTIVWMIAGLLAFAGVFFTAGVTALAPGFATSLLVLMRSLAALVIGRMTNLITIASTSIALGVVDGAIRANNDDASLVAPLLAVIILVALLLQRRGTARIDNEDSSTWELSGTVRPLPAEMSQLTAVRLAKWGGLAIAAILIVGFPHVVGTGTALKGGAVLVFAIVGVSLVVLTGWAGLVSLGQMAFVGVGGAIAAWATVERGVDPLISIIAAGLVGSVVAVIVGLPALRLRGLYLAVTTLALALAFDSALFNNAFIDWIPLGTFDRPDLLGVISLDSATRVYYLALGALVLMGAVAVGLRRSRSGRALLATRDNEMAASAYGINIVRAKLTAFAASGFIAAVAGAVFVFHQASFRAESFFTGESLGVFTATVVGGVGSLVGAIIGAIFLRGSQWLLPGYWARAGDGRRFTPRAHDRARRSERHPVPDPRPVAALARCAPRDGSAQPPRQRSCIRPRPLRVPGGGVTATEQPPADGGPETTPGERAKKIRKREPLFGEEGIRPYIQGIWQPSTWWETVRHPKKTMRTIVGDGSIYALLILFGLNAVDELDRTAFGILLPDIRDEFGMSNTGITSLVALVAAAALLLQLPIAIYADRGNRVRLAIMGAIAWGFFSFTTGLVTTIWALVIVRSGSAIGRAVNDPTHNSLLSDYYAIDRRPGVFSFHRAANATGAVPRTADRGGARRRLRVARALHRVRDPNRDPRDSRLQDARAASRRTGAEGGWSQ